MKKALKNITNKVRKITRSRNQEKGIPEELINELIGFLQDTDPNDLKQLTMHEKKDYVNLVLIDYPAIIDPYSRRLHIYDVKASWHVKLPEEQYISEMAALFTNAFKLIIKHPSELLLEEEHRELLKNIQVMISIDEDKKPVEVDGNLPYLLDMANDGKITDENIDFLNKIQYIGNIGNIEDICLAFKIKDKTQHIENLRKTHQKFRKNRNNPEKVAHTHQELEKSIFICLNSIEWGKTSVTEREELYRCILDLYNVPDFYLMFSYFKPDKFICEICRMIVNLDNGLVTLNEKDLAIFEKLGISDNTAVKQIISGYNRAGEHKRERDDKSGQKAKKLKVDKKLNIKDFDIEEQFRRFHESLEFGLYTSKDGKFYKPDSEESSELIDGNKIEFSNYPGYHYRMIPGHIDVLKKIGTRLQKYYKKLVKDGISVQDNEIRKHAMIWSAEMTAFLANPSFGVDFESLCNDVCKVHEYIKHFDNKVDPKLQIHQKTIEGILKRYRLVKFSQNFLWEYGDIIKQEKEGRDILELEEIGNALINYYENLMRFDIDGQDAEVREHALQWCTKVVDLLAYPEDGIDLVNLYEKANIVIGLLKNFSDEEDTELVKTKESIEENWKKHCEFGSSASHKMSM